MRVLSFQLMQAPIVHDQILNFKELFLSIDQLRNSDAEKLICPPIAISETLSLQHQHRIRQVVQYLQYCVPSGLCANLQHEELGEGAADEVGHRKHEHPPQDHDYYHPFRLVIVVAFDEGQLERENEGERNETCEEPVKERGAYGGENDVDVDYELFDVKERFEVLYLEGHWFQAHLLPLEPTVARVAEAHTGKKPEGEHYVRHLVWQNQRDDCADYSTADYR